MKNLFRSIGGAFAWATDARRDASARLNARANRAQLLESVQAACEKAGFTVETVQQQAIVPAIEVALAVAAPGRSSAIEVGGDDWLNIVSQIMQNLSNADEATVMLQLDVRQARAFVCCTQRRSLGAVGPRGKLTLVDVIDEYNLMDAYQEALRSSR